MPIKEPIRIISDLHLGHHSSTLGSPEQLAPLFEGPASVIFNGDSVELNFAAHREKGLRDAERIRELCFQAGAEPYFINGNHDPDVSILSHADLAGGGVLVTHGDMLFHNISPWAAKKAVLMGKAHTKALAELGDEGFHNLEKRLDASKRAALTLRMYDVDWPRGPLARIAFLLEELWPPWRPMQIIRCWMETPGRAVALGRVFRPRARVIVIGHTHRAGIWRIGPRVVINTGSFMPLAKRFAVDVASQKISVKMIEAQGGKFVIGKEVAALDAGLLRTEEGF